MSDQPRDPALSQLAQVIKDSLMAALQGSSPAAVVSYDNVAQRVNVQPLIMKARYDEDEDLIFEPEPQINDVPVVFPGAGVERQTFPIAKGTTCLLVQLGPSIAAWKNSSGVLIDPQDERRYNINDKFAIFGLATGATPPTKAPTDAAVWWTQVGIRLGDDTATDPLALKSTMTEFMTVLATVVDSAGACATLHSALATAGWPDGFVATKVGAK